MKYTNRILSHDSLSPDIILNLLIKRQSELTKLLKSINSRLHNAPTGTLRIAKRGNAPQYYHRLGPKDIKGTYIKKKQLNLIKNLAQKEYDIRVRQEIQNELLAVENMISRNHPEYIEHLYDSLNEARKELVNPVYIPDNDLINMWNDIKYDSLDISSDTPDLFTDNGEQVRSKSELILPLYPSTPILLTLISKNISYRHERPTKHMLSLVLYVFLILSKAFQACTDLLNFIFLQFSRHFFHFHPHFSSVYI